MKRNIGDIFIYNCDGKPRRYIKTEHGNETYAVYIAKQNPNICGDWFEGCEVHHIDGNTLNDDPNNLICIDSITHHYIHSKAIMAFHRNHFVGKFGSIKECCNHLGIHPSAVSHYLHHGKAISSTYLDYRFAFCN